MTTALSWSSRRDERRNRSLHGLSALVFNLVTGVTCSATTKMEIFGCYRCTKVSNLEFRWGTATRW